LEYDDAAAAIAAAKEFGIAVDFVSSFSSSSSFCDSSSTLDKDRSESIVRRASSANDALFGSTRNINEIIRFFKRINFY